MNISKFFHYFANLSKGLFGIWIVLRSYRKRTADMIVRSLKVSRWKAWKIFFSGLLSFVRQANQYIYLTTLGIQKICDVATEIHIEGESFLGLALASERPMLIVTMHMGDFQIGFFEIGRGIYPLDATVLCVQDECGGCKRGGFTSSF